MTEQNSSSSVIRLRNTIIAVIAIAFTVIIFLGVQSEHNSTSLPAQAKESIAFDTALGNGKPTLTEFYADWCTSCQAMAGDMAKIKNEYSNLVNFVMLNVDNSKWLPEILRYRVDGIPHFIYFNTQGEAIAQAIGEQPLSVMKANIEALISDSPLPYSDEMGQTSQFQAPIAPKASQDDPRSHGSQVKS